MVMWTGCCTEKFISAAAVSIQLSRLLSLMAKALNISCKFVTISLVILISGQPLL